MNAYLIDAHSLAAHVDILWTLEGTLILASRTILQLHELASGDDSVDPKVRLGAMEALEVIESTGLLQEITVLPAHGDYQRTAPVALDDTMEIQIAALRLADEGASPGSVWTLSPEEHEVALIARRERATILTSSLMFMRRLRVARFNVPVEDLSAHLLPVTDYEALLSLSAEELAQELLELERDEPARPDTPSEPGEKPPQTPG